MQTTLIQELQNEDLYDHNVSGFTVLETHISWVILTGSYAYKIKKPVNLGFVDFTRLEQRKFYCHEEIRLNKRLAAELYLDVCKVTGNEQHPVINGPGQAIEYMVKMRQFEQSNLFNHLVSENKLDHQHMHSLADTLARFHQSIECAPKELPYGNPEQVWYWAEQNFHQINPLLKSVQQKNQVNELYNWTSQAYQRLFQCLLQRKQQAFIRECHGDLHLGNIALINNEVTIFDGIDFNKELRWIDVISEIAFLIMDLHDANRPELANQFLDRYLSITGDYDGLDVLPFYLVYRALVRAKVDLLRFSKDAVSESSKKKQILAEYQSYIDLALAFTHPHTPVIFITHGLSGSGKSTYANKLVQALGAIQVRSDIERKRLFKMDAMQRSKSDFEAGIYTANATKQTYHQLAIRCEQIVKAGYSVIIDASFLHHWQRQIFQQLAKHLLIKFVIIDVQAPIEILQERIKKRLLEHNDPSEADLQVLALQLKNQQILTDEEIRHAITVDSSHEGLNETAIKIENYLKKD